MKKDFIKNKFTKEKLIQKVLNKTDAKIEDKIVTVKITKKIDNNRFNLAFSKLLENK